jgi:hypothetical protein
MWNLFEERAPAWRDRYLERRNRELVGALTRPGKTQTERYWEAKNRADQEARTLLACLDGHSRSKLSSKLTRYLELMYRYGVIGSDELSEFSDELRQEIARGSAEASDGR